MNAFLYLILGAVVYIAAFQIHLKIIRPKKQAGEKFGLSHPFIIKCLGACFVLMLPVSALIGRFVLGHASIDVVYILVNSLVATVVFYFGLNPDDSKMKLPE
ncbi:MAG: hypothetical protein Q4G13_04120 [Moraxella sp.]|nr:hypothetical protein [Moraxella sp.]